MSKDNTKWIVLLTVIVGTFLGRLDQTIVNLALPSIINDFGITVSAAGWIATAYILANAVFVPVWGKLGDTIGRKKVYMLGFIGFIIGSVLSGLAWNLPSLIVFRIIQAIAGSADYPTAMAILTVTFPPGKERGQALGLWSASFAAASVFGPLVGGPLIDNFNWRAVFLVNLPVGLIGLGMAMRYIKESVSANIKATFDWWGAITLGIALSSLVLVLDRGLDWGWTSTASIATYLVTIFFTGLFVWIEHHHDQPMVDLKHFSNKIFVAVLANNFIVFMGLMGSVFLIPVFAQTFLGYNATETGFLFIPMAAALMIASPIGGSLTGKIEPRWVIMASTLVAAFGIYLFSFLDPRSGPLDIIIPFAVTSFGLGFGMAQRTNIIASAVPQNEIGVASSILALARNIAGAFGISIFATVLNNAIESGVLNTARNSVIHSTNPQVIGQAIGLITLNAQISGYRLVFFVAASVLLVGAIISPFIKTTRRNEHVEVFVE